MAHAHTVVTQLESENRSVPGTVNSQIVSCSKTNKQTNISSFHLYMHETLLWNCRESFWKCLHSDICLNAEWICRMIMNTKWINNDMWIMNTIYSSSDKIVSFLTCTCINYLPQAYHRLAVSPLAHHRHLLSAGRKAALPQSWSQACLCS